MKDLILTILGFSLMAAFAWGWIANIIQIFNMGFDPLTGEVVLKVAGIFVAPLGAVMGFI